MSKRFSTSKLSLTSGDSMTRVELSNLIAELQALKAKQEDNEEVVSKLKLEHKEKIKKKRRR